ncbi:MAG: hypothetical protein HY259_06145 [Chloroflexi bacterium]|nr:hypothetical protein [Chloroflexota bacterium]
MTVSRTAAQPPAAQGIIEGRAVLASSGSTAPLSDLPVSLFTFINGARQVPPAASQTDAQGRARFEQLNTSANYTYTLYIKFKDTIYQSDDIAFTAGSLTAQAAVKVYDTIADSRDLGVDQHHVVIDVDSDSHSLGVVEVYLLTNNGDRAITGAPNSAANNRPVSFKATLPPGAVIEGIDDRQPNVNVFQSGDQLLDTVPIPPGPASFVFSYRLPYNRSTVAIGLTTPYTVSTINLLVAPGVGVRGARLVAQGSVNAGSRLFQHFSARSVPAGTTLAIELSNLPAPLIPLDVLQWLPLAATSVALAAALFAASRKKNDDASATGQTAA